VKFILIVEGETEAKTLPLFFRRWLKPRLNHQVGIQAVHFRGCAEVIQQTPKRTKAFLNSPKSDVIAVIALLDLYRLDLSYPAGLDSVAEQIKWATEHLEHEVAERRFRQYFAVHELEAWLLSDITIFPKDLQGDFPDKIEQPERVNFNEPPSKLLEKLYLSKTKKRYKKLTYGERLFAELNPETAYQKCPNLKVLLDEMLALAKSAGQ
jgi:hypothetical protein